MVTGLRKMMRNVVVVDGNNNNNCRGGRCELLQVHVNNNYNEMIIFMSLYTL